MPRFLAHRNWEYKCVLFLSTKFVVICYTAYKINRNNFEASIYWDFAYTHGNLNFSRKTDKIIIADYEEFYGLKILVAMDGSKTCSLRSGEVSRMTGLHSSESGCIRKLLLRVYKQRSDRSALSFRRISMVLWRTSWNETALKEDGDQVGGYWGTYTWVSDT